MQGELAAHLVALTLEWRDRRAGEMDLREALDVEDLLALHGLLDLAALKFLAAWIEDFHVARVEDERDGVFFYIELAGGKRGFDGVIVRESGKDSGLFDMDPDNGPPKIEGHGLCHDQMAG